MSSFTEMKLPYRFLVDRIISLNAFGCPLSSLEGHHKSAKDHEADKLQHHSTGIWPKASYINHSCLSNVRRSFIGDLQLVHTTRDLPADTELVFWYHCPDGGSYQETQKKLQNWCFTCDCAICLDLKKTPEKLLKRRNTLLRDLKEVLKGPGKVDLAKAERLLAAAEQTYKFPPSKVPRLRLWDPYLLMTRLYAAQNNPPKVVALGLKVLNCLGFVIKGANIPVLPTVQFEIMQWGLMVDGVLETWLHLWTAYAIVAPSLYQKMEENAKLAYKMCVGEDVTFEKSYGKDIKNVFQC